MTARKRNTCIKKQGFQFCIIKYAKVAKKSLVKNLDFVKKSNFVRESI